MTWLELWTQTPLAKALGWTLLHSLWEGALVALLFAGALGALRQSRARYGAACIALLAVLAAFAVTLIRLWPAGAALGAHHTIALARAPYPLPPSDGTFPYAFDAAELLPWLAPFWILGVLAFHLRALAGWVAARRLRSSGICCATSEWTGRLNNLAARLRVSRPVALFESSLAEAPVVIGYLRPVILMPVGLLAGLPVAQIEAILAHELEHIRRQDYLVNLMQTFVEGLLFYHPAVWWISRQIRAERENCCDDLAVAVSGDAHQYAAALAMLEQNRWTARELALAATGGSLVKRIRRLLEKPERPRVGFAPLASAAVLIAVTAAGLAAWQTTPAQRAQALAAPAVSTAAGPVETQAAWNDAPAIQVKAHAPITETAAAQDQPRALGPSIKETRQAQAMTTPYTKWLDQDVAYIIADEERAAYKALPTDAERETFIEQFWQRRDPTPDTPKNEFKDEHYRRIAYANEHYASGIPGWKTDRGRIYIIYGPPDEIEDHSSGGFYKRTPEEGGGEITTVPFQQWRYRYIEGVGNNVIIEFVDPARTGEFHMTYDPTEKDAGRTIASANTGLSFISVGGDPQVTVEVGAGGAVTILSQQDAMPGKFDFTGEVTQAGKVVANLRDYLTPPAGASGNRLTYRGVFHLSAGSYTFTLTVKNPSGATVTKSVAFYVN